MLKKIFSLTAIGALALAGSALAGDQSRGAPGAEDANIKMVDKNADGKVTRSEAASNQQLSQQFDKLDADKDGALNQAEFAKFEAGAKDEAKPGRKDEPATTTPGTTDDSTPSGEDKLGPGQ